MMLLNHGTVDGTWVVPAAVIDTLEAGGSVAAFSNGPEAIAPMADGDWSYRAQWWIRHTRTGEAISAIGVNGQWIYVDRSRGVAVVKQSSQPVSADYAADPFTLNAFDAVIDHPASS